MWPTSTILNSFPGLPQQIWRWLHLSHSLNCMVGDCSTVTTEEPLGELGYGGIYSSLHLWHFIDTALPAAPRLVLHEILVLPLSAGNWQTGSSAFIYVELRCFQSLSTSTEFQQQLAWLVTQSPLEMPTSILVKLVLSQLCCHKVS